MKNIVVILTAVSLYSATAFATIWQVGPTHTYTMPSQVSTLVQSGDTVAIDSGLYAGDVAHWTANDLVLKGVGGMARLHSGGNVWGGKAIWVISGNNNTVEYIDFAEAACVDLNGAGIRQEGTDLTVHHCYFHDNEDGILTNADANSTVLIEYSEFNHNGHGDGYSHNLYIGHINTLIFRYNYSHLTKVGHELKSRASNNYILYNRISNEDTGTASRNIDLPNGGRAVILGNLIEQGPNAQNSNIMEYGLEGLTNPDSSIFIVNNTFVNDKANGSFIQVQNGITLLKVYNNIFAGPGSTYVGTPAVWDTSHNWLGTIAGAGLTDAANYDYTLLATSPAINAGTNPGMADTFSLTPVYEYIHPDSSIVRPVVGVLDMGTYEYGTGPLFEKNVTTTSEMLVYPNPARDVLNLSLPESIKDNVLIISNLKGELVKRVNISAGTRVVSIVTSGMSEGIYFIKAVASAPKCIEIFR